MEEKKNDIQSLQLFQIIRQQYVAQLLESFKQEYRDKNNNKEPDKELINTFLGFLEKQSKMIDQIVEGALQETVNHVKEATSKQATTKEVENPLEDNTSFKVKGIDKFKEVIIIPLLIAGIVYTLSQEDWVTTGILGVVIIFLAYLWWIRRK